MPEGKLATHSANEEFISYEEAVAREKEYQNRIRMRLQQSPGSISTSFQEMPPCPTHIGTKRKVASGNFQEQVAPRFCGQHMPSQQTYGQHVMQQQLKCQHPAQAAPRNFQDRQMAHQQHNYQQAPLPLQQSQQALPQQLQYQRSDSHPVPQHSHYRRSLAPRLVNQQLPVNQPAFIWCSLCKVPCMTALNLEQHRQGKRHKAKWEEAFGSKKHVKTLWCNECMVPCMNEMALAQHNVGKKHAARLLALQAANSASSSARPEHNKGAALTSYAENSGQLRTSPLNIPSKPIQHPNA